MKPKKKEKLAKKRKSTGKSIVAPIVEAEPPAFLDSPISVPTTVDTSVPATNPVDKPSRLGPYLLLERLDFGGMAEVYLARKEGVRGFEKEVALKCILPKYAANEKVHHSFEQEAKLGSRLSHANIVQTYDFTELGKSYWLVMEYIHGRHLGKLLSKMREDRSWPDISLPIYIACELLKALEYAHDQTDEKTRAKSPVIHRDIAPKNVMLTFAGEVKVVDFGIAKAKLEAFAAETQVGMVKGTPGYMSPEQLRGQPVDTRSDLFCSAVVLFEMLARAPLFFTADTPVGADRWDSFVRARVEHLVVSPALKKILKKGLAFDPNKRFGTASEFRLVLEQEYRSYKQLGRKELAELMQRVFDEELKLERRIAEKREKQIKEMGIAKFKAPLLPISRMESQASWKRSTLILSLLGLTIVTSLLNLYLQLAPNEFAVRQWQPRKVASPESCVVRVESHPMNARAYINSVQLGRTPLSLDVKCGEMIKLELEHEGYKALRLETKANTTNGHFFLNMEPTSK